MNIPYQEMIDKLEKLQALIGKIESADFATAHDLALTETRASVKQYIFYLKQYCTHEGQYSWWEHDAQGIPLCKVCDLCAEVKLSAYRPEILTGYTQADVDEPIEEN